VLLLEDDAVDVSAVARSASHRSTEIVALVQCFIPSGIRVFSASNLFAARNVPLAMSNEVFMRFNTAVCRFCFKKSKP